MTDPRKLRDIIVDQCEAKGITPVELSRKTGTPENYIEQLISGETDRLPAFPYIRPHLVKIAESLSISPDLLTEKYREEFAAMHSGAGDRLPGNRFSLPSHRREYLVGGGILVLIVFGFFVSRTGFLGQPHLTIIVPPAEPTPFIVSSSTILLSGRTDPGDALLVNGQHVPVATDGSFLKEYQLLPEINIIEFSSKRFLGREIKETRQVYFDQSSTTANLLGAPSATTTVQ